MKLFAKIAVLVLIIPALVYALPVSVCVSNEGVHSLGIVTLHYSGGQTSINVTGKGKWTTTVPGSLTGVTINNQRANFPASTTVTLPSGASVRITWQNENLIEVLDLTTQG